jgi:hypothetical protein
MNVIDTQHTRTKEKILAVALNPLRQLLRTSAIEQWCCGEQHVWREQIWGPVVTLLACVWKQLKATASAREVEDWIASLRSECSSPRDGSDFCAARKRLPSNVFKHAVQHVGQAAAKESGLVFNGLQVWWLDGTTLRTPNTNANDAYFGRSCNSIRTSRSPILRMVLLVCAGCGAVLDLAIGPYVTSELALFGQLLKTLPADGLMVIDSGFATFSVLALVRRRDSHVLARARSGRRRQLLKRLGRGDELLNWSRPLLSKVVLWADQLKECPESLTVRMITRIIERRGYRSWKLHLVTTLLDPKRYPADDLSALYLQRWNVELNLRTLKTQYGMAHLTAKTPDIVIKEIYSTVLAYNCVVATIACSGQAPRQVSHVRARELLLVYAERMVSAPTVRLPEIYQNMLNLIRTAVLLFQDRPPQPRAIVQRPSPYPMLMTTRQEWRHAYHAA